MEALGGALAHGFKPGAALLVAAGKFQMDAACRRVGGGGRGGSLVEHSSPIVSQISIHMRPTQSNGQSRCFSSESLNRDYDPTGKRLVN